MTLPTLSFGMVETGCWIGARETRGDAGGSSPAESSRSTESHADAERWLKG